VARQTNYPFPDPALGSGRKDDRNEPTASDGITGDAVGATEQLCRVAVTDPKSFCGLLGKGVPIKVEGEGNPPVLQVTVDRA